MNILQERYQFNQRQQRNHESVEDFASDVRKLATKCLFDGLEESLIRDRILFGLKNRKLSLRIIKNGGNPSVVNIIEMCSAKKTSQRQASDCKEKTDLIDSENVFVKIEYAEPGKSRE